jgi:hypothetical protein
MKADYGIDAPSVLVWPDTAALVAGPEPAQ